jgi:hypothetical protein
VKNGFQLPLGLKEGVGFWGAGVFCADLDDSGAEWYVNVVFLTNEILVVVVVVTCIGECALP